MHLVQALAPDCFGALDFIDGDGNVIEKKYTVKSVAMAKPPAGGKEKLCVWFKEDSRKCFMPTREAKKVAAFLRIYDLDRWKGAVLTMTCGPKKLSGADTMGMIVKVAIFPSERRSVLTPDKAVAWGNAKTALMRDGNLDSVLARMDMSQEHMDQMIAECTAASKGGAA